MADFGPAIGLTADEWIAESNRAADSAAKLATSADKAGESTGTVGKRLKAAATESKRNESALKQLAKAIDKTEAETKAMARATGVSVSALKRARREIDAKAAAAVKAAEKEIAARRRAAAEAQKAADKETLAAKRTRDSFGKLEKVASNVFAGFTVAVVLSKLKQVTAGIVQTGAMFEVLGLQIDTQFGDRATEVFDTIKDFAIDSPGQIAGITAAWVGLKGIGIDPTAEAMHRLDDIAASSLNAATGQARKLEDLAEAIRGAITGETERLKAFNIVARQSANSITLSYKDTEIKVKKSAQEIFDAVVKIGAVNFDGAAKRQMDSLTGAASNLEDAWASLSDTIFKAGLGDKLKSAAREATALTVDIEDLVKAFEGGSGRSLNKIITESNFVTRTLANSLGFLRERIRDLADASRDSQSASDAAAEATEHWSTVGTIQLKQVERFRGELPDYSKKVKTLAERIAELSSVEEQEAEAAKAAAEAAKAAAEAEKRLRDAVGNVQAFRDAIRAYKEWIGLLQTGGQINIEADFSQIATDVVDGMEIDMSDEIAREFAEGATQGIEFAFDVLNSKNLGESLTQDLAQGIIDEVNEAASKVRRSEQIAGNILRSADLFDDIGGDFGNFAALGLDLAAAMEIASTATEGLEEGTAEFEAAANKAAAGVKSAALAIGAALADAFQASRGGQQQTGPLGGQSAGDFAQEGGQYGEAIGSLFGPGWGLFGQVLGSILGGYIKKGADDAEAELSLVAGEIKARVIWAEGGLTDTFGPVADAFADAINGMLEMIGATISDLPENFDIEFRSGQWIKVWGRVFDATEEGIQEALSFAVIQLLTTSANGSAGQSISGIEPEVRQALLSYVGNTLEGFQQTMALALRLADGRLGPEAVEVRHMLESIFADIQAGLEAGIDVTGGFAGLSRARDELLGVARSQEEIIGARIDAYNLEITMMQLQLEALLAETIAREASASLHDAANGARIQADIDLVGAEQLVIESTGAWAQQIAVTAGVTAVAVGVMADATSDAVAAINAALATLGDLRISDADRGAAIRRASGGRRTSGDGGAAQRSNARDDFRDRIEMLEAEAQGLGEVVAQRHAMRDLAEAMQQAGLSAEESARLLDLEWAAWQEQRDARVAAVTADRELYLEAAGFSTDFARQQADIRARERADIEALGPIAVVLGDEGFASADFGERMRQLSVIAASTGLELEELGREALGSLGSETLAARDEAQQTAATIAFLRANMDELGVSAGELDIAIGEIQFNNFSSAMRELLGFLDTADLSDADRTAQQQALIALQQLEIVTRFAALREQIRIQTEAGLISEEQQARLADAIALVDANLDLILDGVGDQFADDVITAGETFSNTVITSLSGFGSGTQADQAFLFLQRIAEMQLERPDLNAVEQENLAHQQLIEEATALAGFFGAFGTSLQEVLADLEEIHQANLAALWLGPISAIQETIDDYLFGPSSNISPAAQQQAQQEEIDDLIRRAQGGDFDAAEQLAQMLPGFLQLSQDTLGLGFDSFFTELLPQLNALGINTSFGGHGGPLTGDPLLPEAQRSNHWLELIANALGATGPVSLIDEAKASTEIQQDILGQSQIQASTARRKIQGQQDTALLEQKYERRRRPIVKEEPIEINH